MTISQAIKKYNLQRQYKDCFGYEYPKQYIHYYGRKETTEARYIYHADNEFSADMEDGKTFILEIQRVSKTTTTKDGFPLMTTNTIQLEREE